MLLLIKALRKEGVECFIIDTYTQIIRDPHIKLFLNFLFDGLAIVKLGVLNNYVVPLEERMCISQTTNESPKF